MKRTKKLIALLSLLCLLLCGCSVEIVIAPAETAPPAVTSAVTVTGGDALTVHYIDVGQADCILLECGGEFMLIDGGNRDDSQLVVSYLESCGVEELKAVVCTHAHEDHVGGLPAVLAVYPTSTVYSPVTTYDTKVFNDFLYYIDQQRLEITIPAPGDKLTLGSADFTVMGPVKSYADPNNTSIILMADFGSTRFLFTGDAEKEAETDMLDYWEDRVNWNVDVLKSGHHGSSTSSGYRFIYETDPEYAIVSCGKDNDYGHPHAETVSLYQDAGLPMLRTDQLGTILAVSDGREVSITWENQYTVPMDLMPAEGFGTYIANKNSRTLHTPFCESLPKEENRIYFESYDDALAAGCKPCGGCLG